MEDNDDIETGSSEIVNWARARVNESVNGLSDWRSQASDAYACVAGDQWEEEDESALEADGRPVFTFNRVAGFIRGICGLETSTRNQVQFFAREVEDSGVTDVINAAVRWVRDSCDADDEESDAFKDMLTCGLGWTETYFSTEDDPDGMIIIERIDPMHMRFDASARKRGLTDTRWRQRTKWLSMAVVREQWGKEKADEIKGLMETQSDVFEEYTSSIHDQTSAQDYPSGNDRSDGNAKFKHGIPVNQFQYWEIGSFMRFIDPFTAEQKDLPLEEFDKLKERVEAAGGVLEGQRLRKREFRQLFYSGGVELEDGPLPCQGFTFNAITGIRDRNNGIWYGFVRDLLDPQRWINKFFSSMADVVASQAKGGLMAEADAFLNKQQAEDEWANPRSILWMKKGALQNGSVKERQSAGVPQGLSQLLEFTVASLPNVAGVNLEFLGLAGRDQAGVVEHQRKQAAISTLQEFFNAFRLYRKQQGRVLVKFIDEFISDGRLVRIVGNRDAKYVPLVKQPGTIQYDIVVDEAPNSPDQKERTWLALTQILPIAASMGIPVPPEVIEYAPFPQSLIDAWKKFAGDSAQIPPKVQEQMQQMQQQLQALQQENQQLKSKREESMAELQIKEQAAQQDAQLNMNKMQEDMRLKWAQFQAEMQLEMAKLNGTMQLKHEEMLMNEATQLNQQDDGEGQEQAPSGQRRPMLTDVLMNAQQQTNEAMAALAVAMQAIANAQSQPRSITDGKGRTFTVKVGE